MKHKILLLMYLIVGLVPYLGAADKVDSQTLYLNFLNVFNVIFFIFENKNQLLSKAKDSISNIPVIMMGLFFIWSIVSIIPAVNKVEALISLSEMFTILIALIFLIYHFQRIKKSDIQQVIFYLISIITCIELISVFAPYIVDIIAYGNPKFQSQSYRGISGNINVMSYSLLLKLPFFLYYLYVRKFNRLFIYSIVICKSFAIFSILETRSAILSITFIILLLSLLFFIAQKNNLLKILKNIIIPVGIGFFISIIQTNYISKSTIQERMSTLLEIEQDQSINQRFRYYSAAIESFLKNPFLGIGVGNWEIEGVKYDRKYMNSYIVPYHAHNDYLEILAESGILAVIFYFGPLFIILYIVLRRLLSDSNNEENLFLIIISCSIIVYLLDSMFNFPQARIMSQMNLIFLLAISTLFINLRIPVTKKSTLIIVFIFLPILSLSTYSAIRVFKSSKDQFILYLQFNNSEWNSPSLDKIEKMEDDYPNVSPSGMPLSSMKAMHFLKADNSDPRKAIDLFIEGLPHNPYLYMTETFLGYAYDVVGDNEKGIYYTKMAFENAPNDVIHFGNYINSLYESKDSISMRNAYKSIPKDFKTQLHDEIYLLVMSGLNDGSEFTLDGIEIDYQAGNDKLKRGYYFSKVGTEKVIDANTSYVLAMEYFNIENYDEAIKLFLQAAELNPYELVYLENAANAYMKIGKDNEALVLLNKLVNEFDAKSPKVFYLRGLLYYDFGDKVKGCENLKIARDSGLLGSTIYNRFCLE